MQNSIKQVECNYKNGDFHSKSLINVGEQDQTIHLNKYELNYSHKPLKRTCQTQVFYLRQITKQLKCYSN